jgi:hypothetical protein
MEGSSVEVQGSTVYAPLLACDSVTVNSNETLNSENSTSTAFAGATCDEHDNSIIWAVIVSLAISMAAVVVFLVFGFMADYRIGPLNKSSVLGMGLFLIFILVQSAIGVWSLVSTAQYWISYYERHVEADKEVEVYGSINLLTATGGVAIGAAGMLLLECLTRMCCRASEKSPSASTESHEQQEPSKQETSPPSDDSADVSSITDHNTTHSWANY